MVAFQEFTRLRRVEDPVTHAMRNDIFRLECILNDSRRKILEVWPGAVGRRSSASVIGPVFLTQTGGTLGTGAAQCSFTYTLKDINGNTLALAAAMDGNGQRGTVGAMNAGPRGIAYKNTSGIWKLIWADETPVSTIVGVKVLTGSGATADTSSWVRTEGTGVSWSGPRVFHDTSGHVIYQFNRASTWDNCGDLYSIGVEVQTTIDTIVSGTCA